MLRPSIFGKYVMTAATKYFWRDFSPGFFSKACFGEFRSLYLIIGFLLQDPLKAQFAWGRNFWRHAGLTFVNPVFLPNNELISTEIAITHQKKHEELG